MARPPSTFDRNTLGSNGSFPLRSMAGPPFAGSQLKNAGDFTAMAPRRDNPLCRSAAHLSKGVLGLAVDMRLVACRRWQLMEWSGRAPAPSASDAGMGRVSKEHRHVRQINRDHCLDGHRLELRESHQPPDPCRSMLSQKSPRTSCRVRIRNDRIEATWIFESTLRIGV